MTTAHDVGSGGREASGALSHLVNLDRDEFADRFWGTAPLLCRADELPSLATPLLDAAAVDELVSTRGLRTPFLRVARSGSTLPNAAFTAPGGVGAGIGDQVSDDKLAALFADGATMVLQGLHRIWPSLIDFTQDLADELGHPVQANAYVTPPQNQGFDDHYDVHDVFVVQVEGEKRWVIHEPVHVDPLRDQPWTDRREAVREEAAREPLIDVVLQPGDCLYLPRGYLHAATALGGVSIHLTLGIHVWTRHTLARELLETALADLALHADSRASLPLGFADGSGIHLDEHAKTVVESLHRALDSVSPEELAARLSSAHRGHQRAAPVGPLAQLAAASSLAESTALVLRDHLAAALEPGPVLRSRAGVVGLEDHDVPLVRHLLAIGHVRADDLGLALARKLIRAGVLVPE